MIVYSKNQSRLDNFNKIKKIITNLNYFEAIDTINDWNIWSKKSIEDNLTTNLYLNEIGDLHGKLGCNLSHQLVLKKFIENYYNCNKETVSDKLNQNWALILEDDIVVNNYKIDSINDIIYQAEKNDSKFIQLYTNNQFKTYQEKQTKIDLNLYKMIAQWGTVSYLIHIDAAVKAVSDYPISTNMDYYYNKNILDFNSFCYINSIFGTLGSVHSSHLNSQFGSLIWNHPENKIKNKFTNNYSVNNNNINSNEDSITNSKKEYSLKNPAFPINILKDIDNETKNDLNNNSDLSNDNNVNYNLKLLDNNLISIPSFNNVSDISNIKLLNIPGNILNLNKTCNLLNLDIEELKKTIVLMINPYYKLVLNYIKLTDIGYNNNFDNYVNDVISKKLDDNNFKLQTSFLKKNSKFYSSIIDIHNLESSLSKLKTKLSIKDYQDIEKFVTFINSKIPIITDWKKVYQNNNLSNLVYENYRFDFMIGEYHKDSYRMTQDKSKVLESKLQINEDNFKPNYQEKIIPNVVTLSKNDSNRNDNGNDNINNNCNYNSKNNNGKSLIGIETDIVLNELESNKQHDSNIFQTLWIGDKLSDMEIISINSFLMNNHQYHLYTYQDIKNIDKLHPNVSIKDANQIIPESKIYTYRNGSYSAFSNLFRFTLLYKKGGYWVDTDIVCLNTYNFDSRIVIVSEPTENYLDQLPTSCLIKLPKGSDIAKEGINIQESHKKLILNGSLTWSSGPKTINELINKFSLHEYILPWNTICSCFCHHVLSLVNPDVIYHPKILNTLYKSESDNESVKVNDLSIPDNMFGIHLWNECWRRNSLDKNSNYPKNSIYQQMKTLYLNWNKSPSYLPNNKESDNNLELHTNNILEAHTNNILEAHTNNIGNDNENLNPDLNTDILDGKINILYIVDKKTYLTKMSRVRFHGIAALQKLDTINLIYSGIGWDNYNNNKSIVENVTNIQITQKLKFDLCVVYKPLDIKNFIDIRMLNIPVCLRYNEMYDKEWTIKEIRYSGAELIICHHLNDYQNYSKLNINTLNGKPVKFYYIGHCAEKSIYKDYKLPKKYDLLLAGCLGAHYPLRNRFKNILDKLKDKYKCHIHPHPGYDLNDAYTDKYQIEFAKVINQSKIALTDSGLPRSRFGKYVEIPACGTLLIADKPDDNGKSADSYSYLVEVNNNMTDSEIIKIIEKYLELYEQFNSLLLNDKLDIECKNDYTFKIKEGLEFSSNYTQQKYADRFYNVIKLFLA